MNNKYAQPGDIIEITWNYGPWLGQRLTVIERPSYGVRDCEGDTPGCAWFLMKRGMPQFFRSHHYKIVGRAKSHTSIDVDLSLRQKLNDNMKEWVGYYTKEQLKPILCSMGIRLTGRLPLRKVVLKWIIEGVVYMVARDDHNSTYNKPLYKYTIITPFVTEKIAAGYMVQRGNEWLTPERTWHRSIFEGAAFETKAIAQSALAWIRRSDDKVHT